MKLANGDRKHIAQPKIWKGDVAASRGFAWKAHLRGSVQLGKGVDACVNGMIGGVSRGWAPNKSNSKLSYDCTVIL